MTLRQKQWLILLVTVVSLILMLWHPAMAVIAVGLVLLLAAVILNLVWMRCPECGAWFGEYPGDYCKDCGAKVPWNETKKRKL